jgi:hypothetical protein
VHHPSPEVKKEVEVLHKAAVAPAPPPHTQPVKPPLGGAKSLREALQAATGKKIEPSAVAPGGHAKDLKETLGRVAPEAAKPRPELSQEKLREMLAVEPLDDAT